MLPKTEVGTDVQMGTVDLILKFKKLRLREVGQWWRRALTLACRLLVCGPFLSGWCCGQDLSQLLVFGLKFFC